MTTTEKLARLLDRSNRAVIARDAGIQKQTLYSITRGKHLPQSKTALRIARALGVSTDWLLDDSQGMPPVWSDDWRGVPKGDRAESVVKQPAGSAA
jgi:DNA-binding XRE family transcriptional regulator